MAELSRTPEDVRDIVRERYTAAAKAVATGSDGGCCSPADEAAAFGSALYADSGETEAPEAAVSASLGCGVPTAVADLHEGETVLDLGSGAGADVLISARRVGPAGRAIGLDMTDEMLAAARANAIAAGVENAEFVKGYIEELPLPDASVDVVISNCVIDLSVDRAQWETGLGDDDRGLVHWALASLMVAEERITTQFAGLVMAADTEEESTFLATQQVDEARHMQFYARFQDEVIAAPEAIAAHVARSRAELGDAFAVIFDQALAGAHARLAADPRDAGAKVEFVTTYHLVIES